MEKRNQTTPPFTWSTTIYPIGDGGEFVRDSIGDVGSGRRATVGADHHSIRELGTPRGKDFEHEQVSQ